MKKDGIYYVKIPSVEVSSKFIHNPSEFERVFNMLEVEDKVDLLAGLMLNLIGLIFKDKSCIRVGKKFLGKHRGLID